MQRLSATVLRSWALVGSAQSLSRRLLHSSPRPLLSPTSATSKWALPIPSPYSSTHFALGPFVSSPLHPLSLGQVRSVSSRERKKRRKPMTPVTSKVKKIKMKFYSSYKNRFRMLKDGTIRRWREGKNHNAHLKSKKSKRRLRQPSTVPVAYAKVMKKLNFCN